MKYLNNYKIYETLNRRGSKSLSEDDFNSILTKNCKIWIDTIKRHTGADTRIFRSQRDMGPYVYTDARGTVRSSIEDINLHIDLMDNLDCWKEYPKYSEAIIGITDDITVRYGTGESVLYEMIPFDNIKIGVCPESTIWSSFSEDGNFGDFIYSVNGFLNSLGTEITYYKSIEGLKKIFLSIENFSKYCIENNYTMHYTIMDFLERVSDILDEKPINDLTGADIFSVIEDYMFNPDARGFELLNYDTDFKVEEEKQVWCNGPVLLIDRNLVNKLRENL